MKIYEALYNPCIHESGYVTISLHLSPEGAQKAIDDHKKEKYLKFIEIYPLNDAPFKFGDHEGWGVSETEVFP